MREPEEPRRSERLLSDEELAAAVRADQTLRKEIFVARERIGETPERATISGEELAAFLRERL